MHLINLSDLEKLSYDIHNNISSMQNRTLTSIKESILRALGYKNIHSFQAYNNKNNNSGLLNYFTTDEILQIAKINVNMENKTYSDFDLFINDLLVVIKHTEYINEKDQIKKINFLKFLNKNNFNFFNYKWFKQSNLEYIDYINKDIPKVSQIYGLDFWGSIKNHYPLVTISLYKSKAYTDYFLENQAIERKKVYTIYDFIKSYFISTKKNAFFGITLDILREHYTLLSNISEVMDQFSISKFYYNQFSESEDIERYFSFKEKHLNNLARELKKKDVSYDDIFNSLNKIFNQKFSFVSSDYNFDKDIKAEYFSLRGYLSHISNDRYKNIIINNLSENILLANKDIFRYDFSCVGFEDRFFENIEANKFIDHFVVKDFKDKEHFYNSWISNNKFLFIYLIYHLITNNEMKVNDFIYFCVNFITNPDLINFHRSIVSDVLSNKYSLFLSNSFFKS